jgi:NADH dehydrogenase (ubiquinone) 1 alpha/beta subcomplex 1, acyl-carrier protein
MHAVTPVPPMDISDIETRIKTIISKNTRLKPEQIRSGGNFRTELGVDSLTVLEVVLSIDREFATDFTEKELLQMDSVDKAVQMVSAFRIRNGG